MRKIFVLLLFFASLAAYAQEENRWALQFGAGLSSLNGAKGFGLANSLNYRAHRWFDVQFDLSHNSSHEGLKNEIQYYLDNGNAENGKVFVWDQLIYSAGLNVHVTPFKSTSRHYLGVGIGGSYSFQRDTYASLSKIENEFKMEFSNISNNGFAPSLSAAYSYRLTSRLALGIRGYGVYFDDAAESLLFTVKYKL